MPDPIHFACQFVASANKEAGRKIYTYIRRTRRSILGTRKSQRRVSIQFSGQFEAEKSAREMQTTWDVGAFWLAECQLRRRAARQLSSACQPIFSKRWQGYRYGNCWNYFPGELLMCFGQKCLLTAESIYANRCWAKTHRWPIKNQFNLLGARGVRKWVAQIHWENKYSKKNIYKFFRQFRFHKILFKNL